MSVELARKSTAKQKQRKCQKFKFKIVIWHNFLSPIKFSENKRPLRRKADIRAGHGLLQETAKKVPDQLLTSYWLVE